VTAEDPSLTTLEAALLRANFQVPLSSPGPFTLFAPTNAAFALVPADLASILNNNEFLPHLQNFLLYHVFMGEAFSTNLVAGPVTALNGESVTIGLNPITVNGIAVSEPDIDATNGVVHKIDGVLTPSWVTNNLLDRVLGDARLSILADLAERADTSLSSVPGEFTFLAATNAAFQFIPATFLDILKDPANVGLLIRALEYNLLVGIHTLTEFTNGAFATVEGNTIDVAVTTNTDGIVVGITFNEANLLTDALLANNGIYYLVDAFLNPPNLRLGETEGVLNQNMVTDESFVDPDSWAFIGASTENDPV
jgi:uncharacterized surface protein with fasciclin (FAS1) repeats